jgi:uncharacterized protein
MGTVETQDGRLVVRHLKVAASHWAKLKGLMFKRSLRLGEALLIEQCKSIHCCFMRFSIDVLFLGKGGEIMHLVERMRPWSFSRYVVGADDVLECFPGTIEKYKLTVGQKLYISRQTP